MPGCRVFQRRKGYTLLELLVVIIIIGILGSLGLPGYQKLRERTMNREARASLQLIRAAERIFRMEQAAYFSAPAVGATSSNTRINQNLRLSLPTVNANWAYTVSLTAAGFTATATRSNGSGRTWTLTENPAALAQCLPLGDPFWEPPQ